MPALTYRRGRDSSGLRKACCRVPPPKESVLPTNQRGRGADIHTCVCVGYLVVSCLLNLHNYLHMASTYRGNRLIRLEFRNMESSANWLLARGF